MLEASDDGTLQKRDLYECFSYKEKATIDKYAVEHTAAMTVRSKLAKNYLRGTLKKVAFTCPCMSYLEYLLSKAFYLKENPQNFISLKIYGTCFRSR